MVKKILKKVFIVIFAIIALYSGCIIFQKIIWKDKTPNIFGFRNYIVLSGSMEPTISIGDIVFVKVTNEIKENDIISFRADNSVITHRVKAIVENENKEKQYITKGDANSSEDTEIVEPENVEGKYCFKIPKIGNIILFLKTRNGMIVLACVFIACLLFFNKNAIKKEVDKKRGRHFS